LTSGATGAWHGFEILVVAPTPTHPQDHGNRKRIFEVCSELKRQGARIHFVHYAAERDWRMRRQLRHDREMAMAWDSYQLVAPSRLVHRPAAGADHTIDEWADADVSHFVGWSCRIQPVDLVIVNYTWLSFCLDAVPPGIFTILDTHDAFSARRELLGAHGIAPEFFHTTQEEEARGLARADLVWAIKPSEAEYFSATLGHPNCLTMLHAEPERGWWQGAPSDDGWLRAGIIGARNNVNRRNLENFLREALPLLQKYMAPVKLMVAGGCADDFTRWSHPNLELMGRMPDVADFYRRVDVVLTPMAFGTGLKIKVAEALASGAPLLSHAHAMEGFDSDEPLHLLPSHRAMVLELVKLAFDRSPLPALAASSTAASCAIRLAVLDALEATRRQIVCRFARTVLIVAPLSALDRHNILSDHFFAVLDHFVALGTVAIHLGGPVGPVASDGVERIGRQARVFLSTDLAEALGPATPEDWSAVDLSDLVALRAFETAYFMRDCQSDLGSPPPSLRHAFVRHDSIELSGGNPESLVALLGATVPVTVLSARIDRLRALQSRRGVEAVIPVPFRRDGGFECTCLQGNPELPLRRLWILGEPQNPLVQALQDLATRLGVTAAVVDTEAADVRRFATSPSGPRRVVGPLTGLVGCGLLVDLAAGDSLAAALVEAAKRAGAPVIEAGGGPRGAGSPTRRPRSVRQLVAAVASALADHEALGTLREQTHHDLATETANDAGWLLLRPQRGVDGPAWDGRAA